MRSRLAALLVLSLATACGSTVQVTSSTSSEQGLGAPAGPDAAGPAPTAGTVDGGSAAGPATTPRRAASEQGTAATTTGVPGSPATTPRGPGSTTLPGVTRTTITIGVIAADPQANETLEDAGFGAASLGDEPASWRAMADEVNSRGGIGGRRLSLVFHLVNLTDPPATQGQAACSRFTQDNTVAVVLSGYYYASAHVCLSKAGVPAFLGTNYGVDAQQSRQTSTVVAWATPLLDRLASALPPAFQRLGKLGRGTSAGVFVTDAPAFRRSADLLAADLTRRGVKVTVQTVRDSDTGDYTGATGDASAAVLRFRSADVTEVLFLTHNAFEPTLLMQAAGSQGYQPTYLLSTQQYPAGLVGLVPPAQLAGAVAVGWAPAIDLTTGYDAGSQAKQCLATMRKRDVTYSSGTQALVGLLVCDAFGLLSGAAEQPGALTSRTALQAAALSPSSGFTSAVTIRTAFPGGRRDGVEAYRPLAFQESCRCFVYTGPAARL